MALLKDLSETTEKVQAHVQVKISFKMTNTILSSSGMCLLQLNSTTLFVIGGFNTPNSENRTYFYNFGDSSWTPGMKIIIVSLDKSNVSFNLIGI